MMKKYTKLIAATVIVAFSFIVSFAATPGETAAASISKGARWLVEHQNEDGSFSNPQFPGLSGLALWAVVGSGDAEYSNAVKKGGDFLISKVQPDGGIYSPVPGRQGGGLSTYNTAVCLTAIAATGRDDITEIVLNARTFLANSQLTGDDSFKGGFGYDINSPRPYADLMNTHFVMEAMRRTQSYEDKRPAGQKRADINWKAALDFAERLHNGPDTGENAGGFIYSPADAKAGTAKTEGEKEKVVMQSYGSITYAGLLALVYCDLDKTDPRVRSTLDWASKHWTLDENPGVGDQGLYFFYNVISRSMSAVGFDSIPRDKGGEIKWAEELIVKVSSLMKEDGSWVNKNGRFWENDPVLATAYSVLALEFASGLTK
ncbi:MAG: hypothetical protein GX804_01250 [Lentisphaerae bacterium]|nr:hypothetical protein [Lentisphaerota bacterium]